jgi:hypothetical protein
MGEPDLEGPDTHLLITDPFLLRYIPLLRSASPDPRFVHIIRDSRAVALSRHADVCDRRIPEPPMLRSGNCLMPLTVVSELTVAAYEDEIELRKSARRPSHLIGCVVDAVTELDNAVDHLMN